MKKISRFLLMVLLVCLFSTTVCFAGVPYKTYTIDGYGNVSETQTAYTPLASFSKIGEYALAGPTDLKITSDGTEIYVADPPSGKVYVSDLKGNFLRYYDEGLVTPTGIFVTEDRTLYVADKSGKIVVFDVDGNTLATYETPNHPLYGSSPFRPTKIAVNNGGDMYIVSEGNSNGIIQISPTDGGTFLGYFGTNAANVSALRIIQEAILSDEQLSKLSANLPSTPANLCIDEKGLIYTVTPGQKYSSLKKLNIAGINLVSPDAYDGKEVGVATGNYNNIYVLSSDGYIYEYNGEGELLFVFGGRDDGRSRIGLSTIAAAIDVDLNDNLYIVDTEAKKVQIFQSTEFTDLLHEALRLYDNGRYTESKEPLTQVLEMNSLFDYANKAMGRAFYQEEDYETALRYARLSKDLSGYSDSWWEIRNVWLRNNLVPAVLIIVAIVAIVKILSVLQKKKGIFNGVIAATEKIRNKTLTKQLAYAKYFMKHPIDGSYGVRWEGKSSYLCAGILLTIFIIETIINKYFCGFLLKTVEEGRYDLVGDIGTVLVVFFLLTACCYLMCTINDGESTFKQLVCGFAYCLTPFLIIVPFIILLGNVVTYNEAFLMEFANLFVYVWCIILIFLAIKEINNYSVKDTIKIIFLTAFTVLIVCLLAFILYVLCRQVVDFVVDLVREAVYRIGN